MHKVSRGEGGYAECSPRHDPSRTGLEGHHGGADVRPTTDTVCGARCGEVAAAQGEGRTSSAALTTRDTDTRVGGVRRVSEAHVQGSNDCTTGCHVGTKLSHAGRLSRRFRGVTGGRCLALRVGSVGNPSYSYHPEGFRLVPGHHGGGGNGGEVRGGDKGG